MCAIVRRIVRPFMSWRDTTPAPTVVGTPSYLAAIRRAEPNANGCEPGGRLLMSECKRIPDDFFENEPGVVTCVGRSSQTWEDCFDAKTMGLARIMARTMLSAMHQGRPA